MNKPIIAELRWESPQGGVDYYQVDAGSGWVNTTETVFPLGARSNQS